MASEKITISNFLHEQSILIVGAKDVITDSLIEKILNHCDVWHIYVVFHNPEGNNFSNREKDKVIFMSGNLSQHNLGLNQDDVRLLRENVSLVIHTGVTDYKATLIDAIKVNLLGTLEVINICCQIKNLKGLVHLSTAFTCTDDVIMEEMIYQQPISPEILIDYSNWMNDRQLQKILKRFYICLDGFVLTKNMSEEFIEENNGFPVAIIRPSIVLEICDAFLTNEENFVVLESDCYASCGNKTNLTVDFVPTSGVVNLILAASWYLTAYRPNLPIIYHCAGSMNSLVKFVKPHRRIDLYEKWKSLRGIKVDFENLYKPYLKEVYRYENNNGKQLESLMNDEDKVIFNIDMSKMPCKFIKKSNPEKDYFLLLKRYKVLLKILLFLFWKKWILKSTPITQVFFATIILTYGLFKAGKGLKKTQRHF